MDRRLPRAPDAEGVLMYRLGLSRQRIAALVRAEPAAVGVIRPGPVTRKETNRLSHILDTSQSHAPRFASTIGESCRPLDAQGQKGILGLASTFLWALHTPVSFLH